MESAKVINVIQTKSTRGRGTSADPIKEVIQYWDLKGNLLFEKENICGSCNKTLTVDELPHHNFQLD